MSSEIFRQRQNAEPTFPSSEWFRAYGAELSRDPEWKVIGQFFSCSYLVEISEKKFILTFADGKLVNVKSDPLLGPLYSNDAWDFAVRAPLVTWEKYLQSKPPPKYHHFFAVTDAQDTTRNDSGGEYENRMAEYKSFNSCNGIYAHIL
ncbi:MAG: hypothetical protein QXX17_08355 [Conexivisphaerales archaeon]